MGVFSPNSFLSKLQHGGALQSLFNVTITQPTTLTGTGITGGVADYQYMTKGATFPESTITATPISYMGREIQIPGNRESTQWTNTVYNDEDFLVRNMLTDWMEKINSWSNNNRAANWDAHSAYVGTLIVSGFKKTSVDLTAAQSYTFQNCWPSSVGEITLDWETNEIQEYEVTWEYGWWEVTKATASTANAGGTGQTPNS
jgi:hypothetical protein